MYVARFHSQGPVDGRLLATDVDDDDIIAMKGVHVRWKMIVREYDELEPRNAEYRWHGRLS